MNAMQKIEEKNLIPLTPLSVADVYEMLGGAISAEAIDYDEKISMLEQSDEENRFLKLQVNTLEGRLEKALDDIEKLTATVNDFKAKEKDFNKKAEQVTKNANHHMSMLDQSIREKTQIKVNLDNAMLTIASYKELGTPKKIREQRKGYQDRIAKHQSNEKQFRLEVKKYRHDLTITKKHSEELTQRIAEIDITEIYSENGENLYLFPKNMQIPSRGMDKKEIVMLYLNEHGRGGLMSKDEDGEVTLGKGAIRAKAKTTAHAGKFLRKWNDAGHVQADDLRIFGEAE